MKRIQWLKLVVVLGLGVMAAGCGTSKFSSELNDQGEIQPLLAALPLQATLSNFYRDSSLNPFVPVFIEQCTWYAYGRIQEAGMVTRDMLRTAINRNGSRGIFLNNANTWDNDAAGAGLFTGTTPQPGSLAIWEGGNHVAYVESVTNGSIQVTESNYRPRINRDIVVNQRTNLRSGPGISNPILWEMPRFTIMRVVGGPKPANGYEWFQLQGNGYTGWAARVGSGVDWNYTGISLQPSPPVFSRAPSIYIYLRPQLLVDNLFIVSKPQRQTFTLTGRGYTPNGQVRRFIRKPNGTKTEISPITANSSGQFAWTWVPQCADAIGDYKVWTIDVNSGRQSNTITQRVIKGC